MKRILMFLLIILILCLSITPIQAYVPNEQETALITDKMIYYKQKKDNAHMLAEIARSFDCTDDHYVIQYAKNKWWEAEAEYRYYESFIQKMEEYPVATIVWLYLKDLGYNDYLCAGILGNMMVEVGGLTMNLPVFLYGGAASDFYGLCMWYIPFSPGIAGLDLLGQLDYLRDNIQYEFDTFGYFYYQGFNYEAFLNIDNTYDAAYAFCVCYERCEASSYAYRMECAYTAYDYFVNN